MKTVVNLNSIKEQDIVKFKESFNEDEKEAFMVVLEMKDERVLVCDLRFRD